MQETRTQYDFRSERQRHWLKARHGMSGSGNTPATGIIPRTTECPKKE